VEIARRMKQRTLMLLCFLGLFVFICLHVLPSLKGNVILSIPGLATPEEAQEAINYLCEHNQIMQADDQNRWQTNNKILGTS
jgi:hypothetical protein